MTPVPETRPRLLLRLRDVRDQQAWSIFLEIYQPLIYRVIRQRRVQDADAREVTQEVLLAVANSIDQWEADRQRGTFRGWLTTITRNLVNEDCAVTILSALELSQSSARLSQRSD